MNEVHVRTPAGVVRFRGPPRSLRALADELAPWRCEPDEPFLRIDVELVEELAPPEGFVTVESTTGRFYPSTWMGVGHDDGWRVIVQMEHRGPFDIGRRNPLALLADAWWRWQDRSYLSRIDKLAYQLWARFAEPMCGLLAPDRVLLLHAACWADDGAIAVAGTGGAGKTTALLQAMASGVDYLADDILWLRPDGTIDRSPRKIMVYAYNLRQVPAWRGAVLGGPVDRLHWWRRRHDERGPRRRIAAERLFGRGKPTARLREIRLLGTAESLPEFMADVLLQEEFPELVGAMEATGKWSAAAWQRTYQAALATVQGAITR